MGNIEQHAPGSFCWIELATSDQNAAKKFYEPVFGWTSFDSPMGPGEFYTMFQIGGRNAAAAYTLNAEMKQRGVPPHWMPYVAVTGADDTAAKAKQNGGTIMAGPFDVMEYGRMAVIQDPTSAVICVWQPKTHPGIGITEVPGTMCWAELSTTDVGRASEFYKAVFGWELTKGDDDYLHIKNGEAFIGGIPPAVHHPPNVPAHWLTYFAVTDCDESTAQAKAAGAAICMGPMTIEKVGRMAVVMDPQGAAFAFFQPFPRPGATG